LALFFLTGELSKTVITLVPKRFWHSSGLMAIGFVLHTRPDPHPARQPAIGFVLHDRRIAKNP
jgi:hypothetical protein